MSSSSYSQHNFILDPHDTYNEELYNYILLVIPSINDNAIDPKFRAFLCKHLSNYCNNMHKFSLDIYKKYREEEEAKINKLNKMVKKYIEYKNCVLTEPISSKPSYAYIKMNTLYHTITKILCISIVNDNEYDDTISAESICNIIDKIIECYDTLIESNSSNSTKYIIYVDKLKNIKEIIDININIYNKLKKLNNVYSKKFIRRGRILNMQITHINHHIKILSLIYSDTIYDIIPKIKLFIDSNKNKIRLSNIPNQQKPNQQYKILGNITVTECYGVDINDIIVHKREILHANTRKNMCLFPIRVLVDIIDKLLEKAILISNNLYTLYINKKKVVKYGLTMLVDCPCCLNVKISIIHDVNFINLIKKSANMVDDSTSVFHKIVNKIKHKFISLIESNAAYDANTIYYCKNNSCNNYINQIPIYNFYALDEPINIPKFYGICADFNKTNFHCNKRKCPTCNWSICTRCTLSPYHEDLPCKGKTIVSLMNKSNTDDMSVNDIELKKLYETCIECPKCLIPIQKIDGCNHIHCTKCSTHLCFRCSAILNPTRPYEHICPPAKYTSSLGSVFTNGNHGTFNVVISD